MRSPRQVWISYAEMETAILTQSGEESSLDSVRKIYERAEQSLKKRNQSEAVRWPASLIGCAI